MPHSPVAIVIPCYNPARVLEETLASVRAQTSPPAEIILVNDGTDNPESLTLLRSLAAGVSRLIEQPNRGLAAARNAGFRAASSPFVAPLDADDRLAPTFIAECAAALEAHPEAAFVYSDYRVFGETRYVERTRDYNLYDLLWNNTLIYASLIRRADWEAAGGYDESEVLRYGYEDWDFWLRLADRERFGHHLPQVLFEYRKHGRSLLTVAREHHEELIEKIRASHPHLYSWDGCRRIKARWRPAVCVLGPEFETAQTIEDWHRLPSTDPRSALERSNAEAFLIPDSAAAPDPYAAELCALAVWGGRAPLRLPCGSLALSRDGLAHGRTVPAPPAPKFERLHRHLVNAELNSLDTWLRHPLRSALRLIPLRLKERINQAAGRPVFDLSFYLRFQPRSVLTDNALVEPLRYMPRPAAGRRRIALFTPHFGPGGAESVLLEVARAAGRDRYELFLIATQSQDSRWRPRWEQAADRVYDLAPLIAPEKLIAAIYSIATNWEFDGLVIQNSLAAYSALPHLRKDRPGLKVVDLIHAVDEAWDFVSATAPVASSIDLRIAISSAAVERLRRAGIPEEKIRLVRNGIDLDRFQPTPAPGGETKNIVFAGRLDPVKRPLLLVDIAQELARLRPSRDFRILVAGDGPETPALRSRLARGGLEPLFSLLGMIDDMPRLLSEAAIVVIPSRAEGIPLVALEAFAAGRPVVCSRAGAADEAVTQATGILIEPGRDEAKRFASALHDLLDNPARRRDMGLHGRRTVESGYSREQAQWAYREILNALFP